MLKPLGVILIFQFNLLQGKLTGDHVCLTEQSYLTNVTEYHIRNATVRNYQWCMNIPPRCSFYTTRTINESKIVERNITRTTEKCCDGFLERDGICTSECSECKRGLCEKGKCICSAGYTGAACEVACKNGSWGDNCSSKCDCTGRKCNPTNGKCISEDSSTTTNMYNVNTDKTEYYLQTTEYYKTTPSFTITSSKTTLSEKPTTHLITLPTIITRRKTTIATTLASKTNARIIANTGYSTLPSTTKIVAATNINNKIAKSTTTQITETVNTVNKTDFTTTVPSTKRTTTTVIPSITTRVKSSKTIDEAPRRLSIPSAKVHPDPLTTSFLVPETSTTNITVFLSAVEELGDITTKTNVLKRAPSSLNEYNEFLIPVEVQYDQISKPIIKKDALTTTPNNFAEEKTFLTVHDRDYINKHITEEKNKMVVNFSIAGTTILVIAVLLTSFLGIIILWRSKNRQKVVKVDETSQAVAVYTASIFHTPLPDPPTFDNPTYLNPIELRNCPNEQISFKTHIIGPRTVDRIPEKFKDYREYVYDHPPSTGSYRAASSIEPVESNINYRLAEIEPVYDEIPQRSVDITETNFCHLQNTHPASLYINTSARTKF